MNVLGKKNKGYLDKLLFLLINIQIKIYQIINISVN
jgi:hypothetical protein